MTTRQEATAVALQWATEATAHLQAAIQHRAQAANLEGMVGARRDQEQFRYKTDTEIGAYIEARQTALMWTEIANLLPASEPASLAELVHAAGRKTVESWMAQNAEKTGADS
ncbi:hypothetical protein ACEZCY_13975 [Streptacidiphilus sp. N1-12]|uniref:Uncharacterized protein n=2 Tax=Streptacidiphilus alkalitolerans TaxID=3342712 RepID=A0ABV6WE55_9ACTN